MTEHIKKDAASIVTKVNDLYVGVSPPVINQE